MTWLHQARRKHTYLQITKVLTESQEENLKWRQKCVWLIINKTITDSGNIF